MNRWLSLLLFLFVATESPSAFGQLTVAKIDQSTTERVGQAIELGDLPGCVICVANRTETLFLKAYGDRQVLPVREPMTTDTIFDMASITKPVATATAVMCLVQDGRLSVDDFVADHLPEFAGKGKEAIRTRHCLLHTSGLIADNALSDYDDGPASAWQRICDLPVKNEPGEKFVYSDVGFIVLGRLVEKLSGTGLDEFSQRRVFEPLEMLGTGFNPPENWRARIAPTEKRGDDWIRGRVHDPRSHRLGGVAGHAGMFSSANDLVCFGRMMLGDQPTVLKATTIELMTSPHDVRRGTRTLGWDHGSPYAYNGGAERSDEAFGHGGFTGTVFWVDPTKELIFVFLSSRLHPDGKGSVNKLAGQIATLWQESVE